MKLVQASASLVGHPKCHHSITAIITGCLPEDRGSIPRGGAIMECSLVVKHLAVNEKSWVRAPSFHPL